MDLPANGFLLRYDPSSQLLKNIEVYDRSKLSLSFSGREFWFKARFFTCAPVAYTIP